jgi:anaerobic dimethyl sulfoxide reductase subunit C (anchor subunit)
MSQTMLVGAIVDLVTTVGYVAVMAAAVSQITQISYYFDPTSPTKDVTATTGVSPFTSGSLAVTLLTIVCAIIPIVAAVMGKKSGNWKVWGAVALVSGFVACLLLRVVFYQMGLSIYPFY